MSSIHYFQRYSQPENVATNNTLLLLSRLYQHSPNKFNGFLNDLLDDKDFEPGILFNQQVRSKGSIPDGSLSQTSFKVVIETKLHQFFSVQQLTEHLKDFGTEQYKILLSLSPKNPDNILKAKIESEVQKFNKANETSVKYISVTFQKIVEKFNNAITDYDFELIQIIDDYEEYCIGSNLITDGDYRMRVVTCGWTLKENFEYNLYYHGAEDGFSEHTYLGLYSNKSVRGIGKISNIIQADLLPDGKLQVNNSTGPITKEQEQNIIKIMPVAKQNNNWDIRTATNFFCVEKFYNTDFQKITKYPLQGTKFFNLKTELNLTTLPATEQIAELLKTITW